MAKPLDVHPLAKCFPRMVGQEFADFREDIRINGLLEAIVTLDGMALDGQNRDLACYLEHVAPRYKEYAGQCGSPLEFVVSANLSRRHPSPEVRAGIGESLMVFLKVDAEKRMLAGKAHDPGQPQGSAAKLAAEATGSSERNIYRVQKVKRDGTPELIEAMQEGRVSMSEAARFADMSAAEQREAVNRDNEKARASMKKSAKSARKELLAKTAKKVGQLRGLVEELGADAELLAALASFDARLAVLK